MSNETKIKAGFVMLAVAGAFAFGRLTASGTTNKEDIRKDTSRKQTETVETTVIKETEKPDGSKEKVTTTTKDTKTVKNNNIKTETMTKETHGDSPVTISVMGGVALGLSPKPVYGLSVTRPAFGPAAIGLWGISNGTLGASVGLSF